MFSHEIMSLAPVRCWDLQLHAHNSPCQYERHTFARSSCATFVHARDCWTALAGDSAKEAWTVSIIILTMFIRINTLFLIISINNRFCYVVARSLGQEPARMVQLAPVAPIAVWTLCL